jgi:hypothetical protein
MVREGGGGAAEVPVAECRGENGREVTEVILPVRAIDVAPMAGAGVFEREGGEMVYCGPVLAVTIGR